MGDVSKHKDQHLFTSSMHEVKGFPNASNGYSYRKDIKGNSQWLRDSRLPNMLGTANGYSAPTTEVDGDYYAIDAPELDINAITWQSGTTVRFTFTAGYDSALYATSSYLQISGAASENHNGVHVITTVNASYLDVTIAEVTDGTDDVASASPAVGYVTHEDYDPENLANGNSIPRQGIVYHDGTLDLWFGNAFVTGDEFYDTSTGTKALYNGTDSDVNSGIFSKKISLTAAQILAATSVDVEAAAGSGYAWEVISLSVDYTYNTTVFDVGTTIDVITETAAVDQFATRSILGVAASVFVRGVPTNATTTQLADNKKLSVKADAVSSTGDGTAEVYVTYRKIKL